MYLKHIYMLLPRKNKSSEVAIFYTWTLLRILLFEIAPNYLANKICFQLKRLTKPPKYFKITPWSFYFELAWYFHANWCTGDTVLQIIKNSTNQVTFLFAKHEYTCVFTHSTWPCRELESQRAVELPKETLYRYWNSGNYMNWFSPHNHKAALHYRDTDKMPPKKPRNYKQVLKRISKLFLSVKTNQSLCVHI